jgi:predicted RNA-binding Zn ribbon-like protein
MATEAPDPRAAAPLPPAPGADRHPALDLANSAPTLPGGTVDLLATPEAATAWLHAHGLAPAGARLQATCADRLRALRGDVRELIAARIEGAAPPPRALRAVNAALTGAPSAALLGWEAGRGLHRVPANPLDRLTDHALAVLAADAADLLTGPDADRLAACGGAPCTRYLVRTHAARHWCSTRCGDRVRAARAYARRTAAG